MQFPVETISNSWNRLSSLSDSLQLALADRADPRLALRALEQFGNGDLVKALRWLTDDEGELEVLARRSYFHGNGFYKIPLLVGKSFVFRLHVWEAGVYAEENLHSHRWPFASFVAAGSLVSEYWEDSFSTDSRAYPELIYRGKNESLDSVGECKVQRRESVTHVAGESYWMNADNLHRIVGHGHGTSVTLMAHPIETRSWSRNIVLDGRIPDAVPSYLTSQELRRVLALVIDALHPASADA